MKIEVESKLLENINKFINLPLKSALLRTEKGLKGNQDLLVLELVFVENEVPKTMVLLLDKKLTEGAYAELADKLTK